MTACRNCATPLADCNIGLRETGRACCDPCITADTHGLLAAANLEAAERLDAIDRQLVEEAARQVIWRSNINQALHAYGTRLDAFGERVARLAVDVEAFAEVPEDRRAEMVAAVIAEAREGAADLPHRVDVLERCLVDLERILKLRRKPVMKELPPPR